MEELRFFLFGVVLFGGVYDALTKRIPNWWTFPAMLAGIVCQIYFLGWQGGLNSFASIGIAFLLYFPLYAFRIMGAGDVKLLMSIGAFSNIKFTVFAAILAIFIGGLYALVETILVGRFIPLAKNLFYFLRSISLKGMQRELLVVDKNRKFSFGISIALATAIIIWAEQRGGL